MKARSMAGHLIRRLNQMSVQVFTTRMQDCGYDLTPVQFAAMDALHASPGIDQAGVAARIAYDRATIGGVIDRLEQKGYVERTVKKSDRRAREVRLSTAGSQVYSAVLPIVTRLQADILPGLTDAERQAFMALATKAVRAGTDGDAPAM